MPYTVSWFYLKSGDLRKLSTEYDTVTLGGISCLKLQVLTIE